MPPAILPLGKGRSWAPPLWAAVGIPTWPPMMLGCLDDTTYP